MAFTGYHRMEKDLWVDGLQPDSHGDRRQAAGRHQGAREPRRRRVELTPVQLANGAKELLDEVATGKITGEEDRYSHTDLWDFEANVEGSQAAVAALRPVIDEKNPAARPAARPALRRRRRRCWRATATVTDSCSTPTLTEDDKKKMTEAVDALARAGLQVAGVVSS